MKAHITLEYACIPTHIYMHTYTGTSMHTYIMYKTDTGVFMQTHVYAHTLTETKHNTTQHNTHTHTNPPSHPGIGMMYSSHGEFLTLPMTVMHTASIHTQRTKLVFYAQSTSAVIQGEHFGEQLGQSSTLMMMDCRVASSAVYSCCNRCTMLALPS